MPKTIVEKGLFNPIKTSKISDEVYKQIVSLIGNGQLKPGDKIPSEREMASELGISRQSIREALNRAEVMGLIQVRQGEGSFILSSVREPLKPPLTVIIEKEAERIFEFLEIRKLIEGWCAEKAALEATGEELEDMKRILNKMKKVVSKDKQWEELDLELHFSIAKATHNIIAIHIMDALRVNFSLFFRFTKSMPSSERLDVLWQHHNEIIDAITRKDSKQAKQKIIDHLNFIEEKIKKIWERSRIDNK
ncbi:MAG: FadR family transcriptional regulator [Deltaproteobacteria bacterium]|nr:MAG: FadR family transcriptional regulator [Deltaproteobacteria bacterium]